jgi:hypothetical protein
MKTTAPIPPGADELYAVREAKRLTRVMECMTLSSDGWDTQAPVKVLLEGVDRLPRLGEATQITILRHP